MELSGAGPLGGLLLGGEIFFGWLSKSLLKVPALKWVLPFLGQAVAITRQRAGPPAAWLVLGAIVVPTALGLLYAALLPKVWTWYYVPSLVLLTVVAAGGVRAGIMGVAGRRLPSALGRALPFLLVLTVVESYSYLAVRVLTGRTTEAPARLATAVWMQENLPPGAVIGAWNAGIYAWYAGRTVVNLDGLVNDEIALVVRSNLPRPPVWHSYWVHRGVTHLVDDDGLVTSLLQEDRESLRPLYVQPLRAPSSKPVIVYEVMRL